MTFRALVIKLFVLSLCLASPLNASEDKAKPQVEREVVQRTAIEGTDEELDLVLVTFPPLAASPPHYHPVVGLNYIIEGTAESQYEGEDLKTFVSGQSYQDPANRKHLIYRNKSREKPLKFLIAFKIKKGASFKIDL